MLKAEIRQVDAKTHELVLGNHVLGTSKTDFDARFHMHAINDALDAAYALGRNDFAKQVGALGPVFPK